MEKGSGNAGVLNPADVDTGVYNVNVSHKTGGKVVTGGNLRAKGSSVKGSAPSKK